MESTVFSLVLLRALTTSSVLKESSAAAGFREEMIASNRVVLSVSILEKKELRRDAGLLSATWIVLHLLQYSVFSIQCTSSTLSTDPLAAWIKENLNDSHFLLLVSSSPPFLDSLFPPFLSLAPCLHLLASSCPPVTSLSPVLVSSSPVLSAWRRSLTASWCVRLVPVIRLVEFQFRFCLGRRRELFLALPFITLTTPSSPTPNLLRASTRKNLINKANNQSAHVSKPCPNKVTTSCVQRWACHHSDGQEPRCCAAANHSSLGGASGGTEGETQETIGSAHRQAATGLQQHHDNGEINWPIREEIELEVS